MNEPRDYYKATVLRLLGNFQPLEFALKAYIGNSYNAIRRSVGGSIHFDYSRKDVEDFPLERLLNVFAKLNGNKELIARLNQLRKDRNHIAHQSLLITFGGLYDIGAIEDKHIEFSHLEDEVSECLSLVIEEARQLKSHAKSAA
jgi:hypothetical protein